MRLFSNSNNFGASFCDKFLQAIRPADKVVELEDGNIIPIRHDGERARRISRQKNMETPCSHDMGAETLSVSIRASAMIVIPGKSQAWVPVHAKLHWLVVVQREPGLSDKQKLV